MIAVLLLIFVAALCPVLPGFTYDMDCWREWASHMNEHGLAEAYSLKSNSYPPLYQYILWIFGKINGDHDSIWHNAGYLRLVSLGFEYWALWIVYKWLDRKIDYGFLLVCSMLNVAYSYNIVFWGQVDGIMAALVLVSFYYLSRQRLLLSAAMLVLALNMKLQAIVYIPLWGLLVFSALQRARNWRLLLVMIPLIVVLQALILLPFAFGSGGLAAVWRVVAELPDAFPYLSMNAFNMWYWLAREGGLRDDIRMLGMTAKQLGLISFCVVSFFAMLPVLNDLIASFRRQATTVLAKETIWLSAALVTLAFFFFNTRMHERYGHGAFIFFTAYAFHRRKFGLYTLFSIAYLLNLEAVLHVFNLRNYGTLLFDPKFIAVLYAGCMVWAFILMYARRGIHRRVDAGPSPD